MRAKWLVDYLATRRKLSDVEVRARREARGTMAKICTTLLRGVKSAATHVYTGLFRKSLGSRIQTYNRDGKTVGIVGVRRGFQTILTATVEKGRGTIAIGRRLLKDGKPGKEIRLKAPASIASRAAKPVNPAKYGPLLEHGKKTKGGKMVGPFPSIGPGAESAKPEAYAICRAFVLESVRGGN